MNAVEIAKTRLKTIEAEAKKIRDWLQYADELEQEAAAASGQVELPLAAERRLPIKQQTLSVVTETIRTFGARSTAQLLDLLTAKNIDPAPKAATPHDKRQALSTMLSKSDVVVNDRAAGGWRLVETAPPRVNGEAR